jgi:hypothetical protein
MERQMDKVEDPGLHEKIDLMLTEARVILPGAQALLGFQLAIVLTAEFERLDFAVKSMHGIALCLLCVSVILLMAPAAYHRIVYAGEDSPQFLRIGSLLVMSSTVPLALGLAADVFVVATKIVPSPVGAAAAGMLALLFLVGCWHVIPLAARASRRPSARSRRTNHLHAKTG